jgi:hypothetical protein
MTISKRGIKFTGSYLALVAISAIPVLAGAGKFSGIYVILTTVPWSLLLLVAMLALDPSATDSPFVGAGIVILSALLNAATLYGIALFADRRVSRGTPIDRRPA